MGIDFREEEKVERKKKETHIVGFQNIAFVQF